MMKCENCGNEHDGSYGSGRFCSKSCRCSFNSKKQKNFPTKEQLTQRKGFGKNPNPNGWICKKCGLKFRTRMELRQHDKDVNHPNNQGWAKGLTKDTDKRVLDMSIAAGKGLKNAFATGKIIFSQKRKNHLSQQRKKFLQEHPEKHPSRLVCNTKNRMTYPEKVTYDWLTNKNLKFESQYHWHYFQKDGTLHQRYVDFFVCDFMLFIEIDGQYWHKDTKEIDNAKDDCAKIDGFKTLRINPEQSIISQLEQYFSNLA